MKWVNYIENKLREAYCTYRSLIYFATHIYFSSMFFYEQFCQIQSESEAFRISLATVSLPKSFSDMLEIVCCYSFSAILDSEFLSVQCDIYRSSFRCKFICVFQNIFYDNIPTFFMYFFGNVFLYMTSKYNIFCLIYFLYIIHHIFRACTHIYRFCF